MSSFASVRSVDRAIDVLQALNRSPVCSLDRLHRETRIPKPTLVRMLETLQRRALVASAPQHGAYCLASGVRTLSQGYHGEPRVLEAATALMEAFTLDHKWPLALGVPGESAMSVLYSTIPSTSLSLLQSSLGMRLSFVGRAIGRAYLAFCAPQEQALRLEMATREGHEEDELLGRPVELATCLKGVAKRGYALRDPGIRPVSRTLAVPVFEGDRVMASIGMTWIASAFDDAKAVERYLQPLQALSAGISARLQEI